MKRIIPLFLILMLTSAQVKWEKFMCCGGAAAPAGIALVANTNACIAACGTLVTTGNVALAGTSAGHLLVVGIGYCQASCAAGALVTVTSVTSSNSGSGETCVQVPSAATANNRVTTDIWYCKNIVGGTDTITVNFSAPGADFPFVYLNEFSGASTSAPLDDIGTNLTTVSSPLTLTTTGNTASSGELLYSPVESLTAATAGNTLINNGGSGNQDEYPIVGAIGTYSNTWTLAGGPNAAGSLAVFKQ